MKYVRPYNNIDKLDEYCLSTLTCTRSPNPLIIKYVGPYNPKTIDKLDDYPYNPKIGRFDRMRTLPPQDML